MSRSGWPEASVKGVMAAGIGLPPEAGAPWGVRPGLAALVGDVQPLNAAAVPAASASMKFRRSTPELSLGFGRPATRPAELRSLTGRRCARFEADIRLGKNHWLVSVVIPPLSE